MKRVRQLNNISITNGECVVYWMSRDQRVRDNWALVYAQELAQMHQVPLVVVFAVARQFLGATWRQYDFMLRGLKELEEDLKALGIPFYLLHDKRKVPELIVEFISSTRPISAVMDLAALRVGRQWREYVAKEVEIPVFEVDAHNVVPVWVASDHQEFAAHTLRPKLARMVDEYLEEVPAMVAQDFDERFKPREWSVESVLGSLEIDRTVQPVDWLQPGEKAAREMLGVFIEEKLSQYGTKRNDPTQDGQSQLSPYLHFGQLSAQRVMIEVMAKTGKRLRKTLAEATDSAEAFLEELLVRRELADNFCFYNPHYDNLNGAAAWAMKSLQAHAKDLREHVYTYEQFEKAQTHDEIWNAAQNEMVTKGKMHGYMRMYWAKKILEWTKTPEEAIEIAIALNDKYELDGRDPNGYVGIMWSIAGVHDRPWFEREVFGQIRYMNAAGLRKKFDVEEYVR